ncbi:MAG: hypothetical protein M3R17_21060 [Bacteroidota bacterium]|nr:hypothetical protein [Bacteroidota bacterium]
MRLPSLIKISLHHDYSRDGFCHGLELVPSPATKAMMEKNGMLLKMRDGKYEVIAESFNNSDEIRYLPFGSFRFNFFLVLKNSLFFNCTDLPLSAAHRFPFFSNAGTKSDTPLLLHNTEVVTSDDLLEEVTLHGKLPIAENGKAIIRNEVGEIVYEADAAAPFLSYDLSAEGNGKYTLELNGKQTHTFYACTIPFGMTVRGAIDIWHHPQILPAADFLNADSTVATKEYKVHFGSRKTYWNYLITGNALSRFQSLAITDAKRELFFTGPQPAKLFNGSEGVIFTSPEPLTIREANDTSFQLRRNCTQDNAGFPVIERLPSAKPDLLLQPEKDNEKDIYSEIIVYL